MCECKNCGEKIVGEKYFRIMIYKGDGTQAFVNVCSETCVGVVKDKYSNFHQKRADDVRNQRVEIVDRTVGGQPA